ncbi:aldehyde dehydrogenase [Aliarcobacter cryaerophilus ATCC 43158]|uniref:Dessication/salinity stress-associated aldehyde dehydrogenase n=1 Tax=Aliarcobacter cryaerophilus ATCC 43158 TaxID=1032070 RepID=A0AAD0TUJ5_9BACT|nr:aldehyde dehydrogenase family protein [Aliarcobacter cryaerophilus]AYJ79215.1 putative dessication/salinity stress-associated aldehyde dehydrogenase [Aliarcobacter cryaerophilus ATCC 43158]PRM96756.1 aldehyde dehydrogenase [Aliarcobacter cryaerophilus]QCZ23479.1 aldehyde dehydrogenase [Aliarcobacter cryaerophilus ATCC 43158]
MSKIDVTSPFDGKVVGSVNFNTYEEVEAAIDLAHKTFVNKDGWLPKYKRVEILENVMKIMSSQVEELTILCASEGGKPYIDSKVEILRAINGIKIAIEHLSVFEGKEVAMGHTNTSANRLAYTFKEPIGVVAAISAFNHPFNLAVHQVIPAIAAGCPVIIRPATQTPMSAVKLVEILKEAGLPNGWAQSVVCDRKGGELLATSPKTAFLTFIGSGSVGWYLNSKASDGTRVVLEHGGVAPVIVEADADIEDMIPALAKGGFYHAGQVCVSVQRVFVQESICEEVASKLATAASKLIVGNQLDPKTEVGPLINNGEVDRIEEWVNEAVAKGGKILTGGKRIGASCFEPTVILNPAEDALISTKEVFGPVVCIYSYKDLDEAIDRANQLDVSFQAAVFTKNIDKALKTVKRLNATAVMVNDHTAFRVDWMPFGGAKVSGLGMGGIPHSMHDMSVEKMMVIKSPVL